MQKGDLDVFVSGGIQCNYVYVPGKQEYRVLHPLKNVLFYSNLTQGECPPPLHASTGTCCRFGWGYRDA